MSPVSRTAIEIITEALEHFDIAISYSQRDLSDQIVIDAIAMRLSAGVEALGALDPDIRAHLFLAASGRRCGECVTASLTTTVSSTTPSSDRQS